MSAEKKFAVGATDEGEHTPDCVCTNLRRATRAITQLYDDAIAAAGINITQFSLLRAIERNARASINALAQEQVIDRTTLARNLRPLHRDGLIALSAGADKRVVEVALTARGRQAIARALPLWQHAQREVRARLGAEHVADIAELAAMAGAMVRGA